MSFLKTSVASFSSNSYTNELEKNCMWLLMSPTSKVMASCTNFKLCPNQAPNLVTASSYIERAIIIEEILHQK